MTLANQIVGRLSELHEKVPGLAIIPRMEEAPTRNSSPADR